MAPRLMTVAQAALTVSCHQETVRRAYQAGRLRACRFGVRGWRIRPEDLSKWIDEGMPTR
jgi:excisionase family DNA binding protein